MGQATEEERNRLSSQTQPADAPEPAQEPEAPPVYLLGSDVQPSVFLDPEGKQVQLGEVVGVAYDALGCETPFAWNNLSSEEREAAIAMIVEERGLVPIEAETAEDDGQTDDAEGDVTDETPAAEPEDSDPEEDFQDDENL